MHLSNKYVPFCRGAKPFACWKISLRQKRIRYHQHCLFLLRMTRYFPWYEVPEVALSEDHLKEIRYRPGIDGALRRCYMLERNIRYIDQILNSNRQWETNQSVFGAFQNDRGAWKNHNRKRGFKIHANRLHRRREKQMIQKYRSVGDYEEPMPTFLVSTGYWD